MRIACLGSGLPSLLFALAAKRGPGNHDVTVLERPETAAAAPGMAFSDRLGRRLLDRIEALLDHPVPLHGWSRTMVFRQSDAVAIDAGFGQGADIAELRRRLRDGAAASGCIFRPADEGQSVGADFDLVAAEPDDEIQVETAMRPTRFASFTAARLAADRVYEIARTGGGVFFAHGFACSAEASLYVVEARDEAWAGEGLIDGDGPALRDFAERLFAKSLGPSRLSTAAPLRPMAIRQPLRGSRADRVTLGMVGDAALPTSPYRRELDLADALALAAAIAPAGDPATALARHDKARSRLAASAARAAELMAIWVETLERYIDFPPRQFAFALLTRSLRVNHRDLQRAAPAFVRSVDRDFAGIPAEAGRTPPPPMFVPLTLRGVTFENRIGFSPMCMYSAKDGMPDDFQLVHLGSRAQGGAGLVFTEMTDVSPEGRITWGCAGMYRREHVAGWRRIVDYVHARTTARIAMQLAHAGRRAATARPWEGGPNIPAPEGVWETLAPSAIPYADALPAPREMTHADIDRVLGDFVRAAEWSAEAGFDLLELHMAHGYLLSGFLSPLSNRRSDAFGGSLANRARFPLAVAREVRRVWPDDKPLAARISAVDWAPGGISIDDMIAFVAMLKAEGVDIVDVSTGNAVNARRPATGRLFQTPFSDRIRNAVKIPTMTVGRLLSYGDINGILAAGRADICLLAKAHLKDPYFTRHAAEALGFDLRWPDVYESAPAFALRVED